MNDKDINLIDNANAAAVLDIIQKILANTDNINIAGKSATEAIRDLSGSRAVLLTVTSDHENFRTVSISPSKREYLTDSPLIKQIIKKSRDMSNTQYIENIINEFGNDNNFQDTQNAIIAPLISSGTNIGSLILIGLPAWDWGYSPLIKIINLMTDLLALTMQTALFCESQEETISQRTSELIKTNNQLLTENNKRRAAEKQLKEYNSNLENMVRERTQELSEKNEMLITEISERKIAEEKLRNTTAQLIQTEKLVSIGQLAAGVAHEINGPLGAITSSNEIVKKQFSEIIEIILDKLNSCADGNDYALIKYVIENQNLNGYATLSSREKRKLKSEISANLVSYGIQNYQELTEFIIGCELYNNYKDHIDCITRQDQNNINLIKNIVSILQCTHINKIAVQQASKVVNALRYFARSEENSSKSATDVQSTIETAITLYGNIMKHGIYLNLQFEKVPMVMGYADKLCQVWTNLLQNAVQAMNQQGTISISLKEENNMVRVDFTDNGPGIPEEIIGRIFEPLFTTKKPGEGTGLGLDIAKQIIEKHNGKIWVNSKTGQGTTFTITLPLEMPLSGSSLTAAPRTKNGGDILL